MTTRAQKAWRSGVVEHARQSARDFSEVAHDRPAEETVGTLDLLLPSLVKVWTEYGFSREDIERSLSGALDPSPVVEEIWVDEVAWRQADKRTSRTIWGRCIRICQWVAGSAAALGFLLFFVNALVAIAGGPARTVAWLAPSLLIGGIAIAIATTGAKTRLTKRELNRIINSRDADEAASLSSEK